MNSQSAKTPPKHDLKTARTLRRADAMFLLDCTATMENTLNVVTSTIDEVVETYADSKVQIWLGLVEFHDLTQPPRDDIKALELHTFDGGSNFTSDVKLYQAALLTHGGRWRTLAGINVGRHGTCLTESGLG